MPTLKHKHFVDEPLQDKPVTALPGIGLSLGRMLQQQGFDRAYLLVGQFLMMRKNTGQFSDWLRRTCGANPYQATSCAMCLKEYCDIHL